jgi:hypothetical protein
VVERLPSKSEALSSNPRTATKKALKTYVPDNLVQLSILPEARDLGDYSVFGDFTEEIALKYLEFKW